MRKFLVLIAFSFILSASVWESGTIVRVVDGDTMVLKANNKKMKVRLIGVDTLESFKNDKLYKQAKEFYAKPDDILKYGKKAKGYAMMELNKRNIKYISYGKDKYNRLLIWIKGFNYRLVARGYAQYYRWSPLDKVLKDKLLNAEKQAKINRLGIWQIWGQK